jgi:hypothetical protein
MFRRYWAAVFAFGLALASPVLAQEVGLPRAEGQIEAESKIQAEEQRPLNDDQTEDDGPQDLAPALNQIESAIREFAAQERSTQSQGRDQYDVRDLDAQEQMAFWTQAMFWASAVAVVFTLAGLVLIAVTLHHTKRAADYGKAMVDEARKTTQAALEGTQAARDTVEVTREIGEAQARAYILPIDCRIVGFVVGNKPFAVVKFKNVGATPADKVTVLGSIVCTVYPQEKSHFQPLTSNDKYTTLLSPGIPASTHIKRHIPLTTDEVANISEGKSALYIYVSIVFTDVFGRTNRSRTTFVYTGPEQDDDKANMAPYGNSSEWGTYPTQA